MRIILRPMTDEAYRTYLQEHEEEYARDRMITDQESFEDALRTTHVQHDSMLPQGLRTFGHYFFTMEDEEQKCEVGYLWFAYRKPGRELFLYHILVKPAYRRRGYGRLALQAIDDKAKELDCRAIWLNVMAHNQDAIAFYRENGYRSAAIHMNKHFTTDD